MKNTKHQMKSSKHQAPNTREEPGGKHQIFIPTLHETFKHQTPGPGHGEWVSPAGATDDAFVLREDSPIGPNGRHPFDLEERTAVFGEKIVRFSKKIPRDPTNNRLIDQLVGAGTSVGANYCEANDCVSRKDFRYTIKRCLKESKETRFFLRMVASSESGLATEARDLYREATELVRIFASMYRK
jgi:four helix bundle protein